MRSKVCFYSVVFLSICAVSGNQTPHRLEPLKYAQRKSGFRADADKQHAIEQQCSSMEKGNSCRVIPVYLSKPSDDELLLFVGQNKERIKDARKNYEDCIKLHFLNKTLTYNALGRELRFTVEVEESCFVWIIRALHRTNVVYTVNRFSISVRMLDIISKEEVDQCKSVTATQPTNFDPNLDFVVFRVDCFPSESDGHFIFKPHSPEVVEYRNQKDTTTTSASIVSQRNPPYLWVNLVICMLCFYLVMMIIIIAGTKLRKFPRPGDVVGFSRMSRCREIPQSSLSMQKSSILGSTPSKTTTTKSDISQYSQKPKLMSSGETNSTSVAKLSQCPQTKVTKESKPKALPLGGNCSLPPPDVPLDVTQVDSETDPYEPKGKLKVPRKLTAKELEKYTIVVGQAGNVESDNEDSFLREDPLQESKTGTELYKLDATQSWESSK
ncbi:hypothetical protein QR680_004548 [Steinernema hermaphroditum]|uniref:Uncharacterized protein n=1 Tax=Steinernema hermaphroditum TaxID=289476 RepID=A0AA39LTV5_9BILA|nr:hypothetical protein QR680_004548 [Steinernema hermaphroditum]